MADGRVQELPSRWSQHVDMFITQFSLSLHYTSMIDDIDGHMIEPHLPRGQGAQLISPAF